MEASNESCLVKLNLSLASSCLNDNVFLLCLFQSLSTDDKIDNITWTTNHDHFDTFHIRYVNCQIWSQFILAFPSILKIEFDVSPHSFMNWNFQLIYMTEWNYILCFRINTQLEIYHLVQNLVQTFVETLTYPSWVMVIWYDLAFLILVLTFRYTISLELVKTFR